MDKRTHDVLEDFCQRYEKMIIGFDKDSVSLNNICKHFYNLINQVNPSTCTSDGLDFEAENKYISQINKEFTTVISDFNQGLITLKENSIDVSMTQMEYQEFSNELSQVSETIKNRISEAKELLVQYDNLLDQKLRNMYSVDARNIDLTLILDVSETFSSEKNLLDKFEIASKELLRTIGEFTHHLPLRD